jgi:hypothetical protein
MFSARLGEWALVVRERDSIIDRSESFHEAAQSTIVSRSQGSGENASPHKLLSLNIRRFNHDPHGYPTDKYK